MDRALNTAEVLPRASAGHSGSWLTPIRILWLSISLALLALVPNWNLTFMLPADTVWLLHAGQELLAGKRLYIDVIETNPPMSVLLYLPALVAAKWLGIPVHAAVFAQTLCVAGLSLLLCWRLITSTTALPRAMAAHLLGIIALVYLVVINTSFTQREHYALMLLLPYILSQGRLAEADAQRPTAERITIALLAGLATCIKPHFLLVPIATAGTAALLRRSWRPIVSLETAVGLSVFSLYAALVLFAFPGFFGDIWPLLRDVYLRARVPFLEFLLTNPPSRLWLALAGVMAFVIVKLPRKRQALVWLAGIVAFTLVFWAQGKGFIYHVYPASGLAIIAIASFVLSGNTRSRSDAILLSLCTAVALFSSAMAQREPFRAPELLAELQRSPAGTSLITVTGSMEVSIGLLGQTSLHWASRLHLRWITQDSEQILAQQGPDQHSTIALVSAIAFDRRILAEDIIKLPDILVFDRYERDWEAWARQDPVIARTLDQSYAAAGTFDGGLYQLYRRRGPPNRPPG
jgi:hypothetical protein